MRILVVDDHADTATVLATLLGGEGHEVEVALTLADARALCSRETFDVLVCDLWLPDGFGWELMKELRAPVGKPRVAGIALSACGDDEDKQRSREAGFSMHLTKPIHLEALLMAVEALRP